MKIVRKIHQACVPACIESFLSDFGIMKSQHDIINELFYKKLCSSDGIVADFVKALNSFGFDVNQIDNHFPIRSEYKDGSLFLLSTQGCRHCVRFNDQPEHGKILVMDPDFQENQYRYMDKKEFMESGMLLFQAKKSK